MALPHAVDVPPGNLLSCFYTFVPGGSYVTGDCSYSFTGATVPQNINGFGGIIWGQTAPHVSAVSNYQNQQVDPQGWNMGTSYSKKQRHAVYSTANSLLGDLTTAPIIYYKISGINTTRINELGDNNFSLDQNIPNPFTDQTKINYQIKSPAKSVSLIVYDITGVKVFEKTQSNVDAGAYSVDISAEHLTSGLYYYLLQVNHSTAAALKMVVTK